MKKLLLDIPGFTDKGRNAQRLHYKPDGAAFKTVIDIIPFGKLETAARTIAWPPDADVVMNVAAFSDVFEGAVSVQLRPDLFIPVASLPGLTVLKLFAWLDRHDQRDVQDIRRLMETYTDTGNVDRLYQEEGDELERVSFDTSVAGSYLLRKDAQRITDETVRIQLSAALSGKELDALILQLARTTSVLEDRTESAEALLHGFFRGMGLVDQSRDAP